MVDRYVILTGFEPFGEWKINPTQVVAEELDGSDIGGYTVRSFVLPVDNEGAEKMLETVFSNVDGNCAGVIHLGLHSYAEEYRIERVAINMDDFRIPDNIGNKVDEAPIVPGGENAFFSTIPVKPFLLPLYHIY